MDFLNNIIIESDSSCHLPNVYGAKREDVAGNWKIKTSGGLSDSIVFDVCNSPFHGIYKLAFYKDSKEKLYKPKLSNNETILICRKRLQFFNNDKEW